MFSLKEKLAAVNLVRSGLSYRAVGRALGISHVSIWNWHHAIDGDVDALYDFIDTENRSKDAPFMDLDNLPDDPEELKRIIRDQQFEIDITKAVVELECAKGSFQNAHLISESNHPCSDLSYEDMLSLTFFKHVQFGASLLHIEGWKDLSS